RNNISHEFLHLILLLSLLWLKITSATPHGNRVLCIDKERHALLHFKANVNLDRYGLLSIWTHGQEATNDCCNWNGVTCNNQTGHVTRLELRLGLFTGTIPYELTNLHELIALNLSMNALHGEIPPKIGRIPSSTQLQSFEPSKYTGNELCGPPLTKYCPGDKGLEISHVVGHSRGGNEGMDELERWYYIGGVTGFATGFWIACGTLLVNRRVSLKAWVYVKVMASIAKWN
ncbi:hypothetical protein M8C21_030546, partial [Ambrosia artemisiifolia]